MNQNRQDRASDLSCRALPASLFLRRPLTVCRGRHAARDTQRGAAQEVAGRGGHIVSGAEHASLNGQPCPRQTEREGRRRLALREAPITRPTGPLQTDAQLNPIRLKSSDE